METRVLRGTPASPGAATGRAFVLDVRVSGGAEEPLPAIDRPRAAEDAEQALIRAAADLEVVAARLRADGRAADAEIVETGALMAQDPMLTSAVRALVTDHGRSAASAIGEVTEQHAQAIAAVDDPGLAARADDVRSLGRRAARIAAGRGDGNEEGEPGRGAVVIVATDLGPADVAEFAAGAAAIALAGGSSTAHAAIVARSLGLPMVVGLGPGILETTGELVVDGDAGQVICRPEARRVSAAREAMSRRRAARDSTNEAAGLPAVTRDGRRIRVLANVASTAEWAVAEAAGAEGIGLLRTELAFLAAPSWPSEAEHRRALAPLLRAVAPRLATIRVLDLGGDKSPPFLALDEPRRGIELLLAHPEALSAQLRAILAEAGEAELRVLIPLVRGADDLAATATLLRAAAAAAAAPASPSIGAMVETPQAAAAADALARGSDFLSIGTNDLAHSTLGTDRFGGDEAPAYDPRVLACIAQTAAAARRAGIPLEVCGEAASDPACIPLLVGLGIDELSVGAARVGAVRAWVRALDFAKARDLAREALAASSADAVHALVAPLAITLRGGDPSML